MSKDPLQTRNHPFFFLPEPDQKEIIDQLKTQGKEKAINDISDKLLSDAIALGEFGDQANEIKWITQSIKRMLGEVNPVELTQRKSEIVSDIIDKLKDPLYSTEQYTKEKKASWFGRSDGKRVKTFEIKLDKQDECLTSIQDKINTYKKINIELPNNDFELGSVVTIPLFAEVWASYREKANDLKLVASNRDKNAKEAEAKAAASMAELEKAIKAERAENPLQFDVREGGSSPVSVATNNPPPPPAGPNPNAAEVSGASKRYGPNNPPPPPAGPNPNATAVSSAVKPPPPPPPRVADNKVATATITSSTPMNDALAAIKKGVALKKVVVEAQPVKKVDHAFNGEVVERVLKQAHEKNQLEKKQAQDQNTPTDVDDKEWDVVVDQKKQVPAQKEVVSKTPSVAIKKVEEVSSIPAEVKLEAEKISELVVVKEVVIDQKAIKSTIQQRMDKRRTKFAKSTDESSSGSDSDYDPDQPSPIALKKSRDKSPVRER